MISIIQTVFSFVVALLVFEFLGYVIHKILHNRRFPKLMKPHMTHHLVLYPPENFLSSEYRNPGKDNTIFLFLPFVVCVIVVFFVMLPAPFNWGFTLLLLFHSWLTNYIHGAIHIEGHFLEKYRWFMWLRHLHLQHHINMRRNLGILTFGADKLLDTYTTKAKPKFEKNL